MIKEKLDFWLKNKWNVLLTGKHGIGKTTLVLDCFKRANLKYLYFSASTMDVWVDFIGLPEKEKIGEDWILKFVGRQNLKEAQAIFIDELNRPSSKKILNALMEFIQFKSINGEVFPNLQVIWGAINPEDDETGNYDVEMLDDSQKDRFQIQHELPYKPDSDYFISKYGEKQSIAIINWWNDLSDKDKNLASPRRLDYALEVYNLKGDIRDVLSKKLNVSKLLLELKTEPINKTLQDLFDIKDTFGSEKFLTNENNYRASIDKIVKDKQYLAFFFPLLLQEKKMLLLNQYSSIRKFVQSNPNDYLEEIKLFADNNPKHSWTKKINKFINISVVNVSASEVDLENFLNSEWANQKSIYPNQRLAKYKFITGIFSTKITNKNNIDNLLHILVNDLFFPSQKSSILKMEQLIPMMNYLISLSSKEEIKSKYNDCFLKKFAKFSDALM